MKIAKIEDFKNLFVDHFSRQIESVNRARRGEEVWDYEEESEGAGTTYEGRVKDESVDSVHNKSKERKGDYEDEYEGPEVSYEVFKAELDETNLYSDSDKRGRSEKTVDDNEDVKDDEPAFPGSPQDLENESKTLSLKTVYAEGFFGSGPPVTPPEIVLAKDDDDEESDDDKKKG